tara:strand:- start:90 stop:317 length:228 start_codon:yes stop_codon:yes gene_type:complete
MPFPFQHDLDRTRSAPSGEDLSSLAPQTQLQPGGAIFCEHNEVEQGEEHYGPEDHQYMTYWFCADCGEELEDEVV